MSKIEILVVKPKEEPYVLQIYNQLVLMQDLVGGYIETITREDGTVIICNEEAKINGLPANRWNGIDMIFGTFFVCRAHGDQFESIKPADVDRLTREWRLR